MIMWWRGGSCIKTLWVCVCVCLSVLYVVWVSVCVCVYGSFSNVNSMWSVGGGPTKHKWDHSEVFTCYQDDNIGGLNDPELHWGPLIDINIRSVAVTNPTSHDFTAGHNLGRFLSPFSLSLSLNLFLSHCAPPHSYKNIKLNFKMSNKISRGLCTITLYVQI